MNFIVLVMFVINLFLIDAFNKPILLGSVIPDENEVIKGLYLKLPPVIKKTAGLVKENYKAKPMSDENRKVVDRFWKYLESSHATDEDKSEFHKLFVEGSRENFPERGVDIKNNKIADKFWKFLDLDNKRQPQDHLDLTHDGYESLTKPTEESFWTYSSDVKKRTTKLSTTLEPAFSRFWEFVKVEKTTQKTTPPRTTERTRPDDWYRPSERPSRPTRTRPLTEWVRPTNRPSRKPIKETPPSNNEDEDPPVTEPAMQLYEYFEQTESTYKPKERPTQRTTDGTKKPYFGDWDDFVTATKKGDAITERQTTKIFTTPKPSEQYYDDYEEEVTTKRSKTRKPAKKTTPRPPERTSKQYYDDYGYEDVTTKRLKPKTTQRTTTTRRYNNDWDEDDTTTRRQKISTQKSTERTTKRYQSDWDDEETTTKRQRTREPERSSTRKSTSVRPTKPDYDSWDEEITTEESRPIEISTQKSTTLRPTKRTTRPYYYDWDDEITTKKPKPVKIYTKETTLRPERTTQADYDDWDAESTTKKSKPVEIYTKKTTLRPERTTELNNDEEITTKKPKLPVFSTTFRPEKTTQHYENDWDEITTKKPKPVELSTQKTTTLRPTERTTELLVEDWEDEVLTLKPSSFNEEDPKVDYEYEYEEDEVLPENPKVSTISTPIKSEKTTKNYFNIHKDQDLFTKKKLTTEIITTQTQPPPKKTTKNYFVNYNSDSNYKKTSPEQKPTTSSTINKVMTSSEEPDNLDDWGLPNFELDDVSKKPEPVPTSDDFFDWAPNDQNLDFSILRRVS